MGYKIISVWKGRVTRLQEGMDYNSLSEGKESYLGPKTGPLLWTWKLDLSSVFRVCLFIDDVNHGKSSKVT